MSWNNEHIFVSFYSSLKSLPLALNFNHSKRINLSNLSNWSYKDNLKKKKKEEVWEAVEPAASEGNSASSGTWRNKTIYIFWIREKGLHVLGRTVSRPPQLRSITRWLVMKAMHLSSHELHHLCFHMDQISPGFTRSLLAHYVSLTMNLSYSPSLALPLCFLKSRSPHILTSSCLKRAIPSPLAPFVLDSLVPLRTGSFLSFFWIHSPITKENQSLHAPCCMAFLFKEAHLGRLCVMKPVGSNRPTK